LRRSPVNITKGKAWRDVAKKKAQTNNTKSRYNFFASKNKR